MKVKNIMFSGFAAAILMGVVAEASAAPVAVASKGYVDSIAGQLDGLDGSAAGKANLVEAINTKLGRVAATGEALEDGEYYSRVTQAQNGQVAVQKANLATTIEGGVMKAPTTDAVHAAIQEVSGQTSELDLDAVGGDGKYVKLVSQADGQVSAVEGTIDTELDRTSNNPVTNKAITTGLGFKQDLLRLGDNLSFDSEGKLNAKDTTYTGTGYINIDSNNVITATGLQPTITDGADTTTTTGFISEVKQDNGTVTAAATAFDTEINATTGTNTNTAPTTAAVYNAIQGVSGQTSELDLDAVGGDGKYVKLVSQSNGQLAATEGTIDTAMDRTSNNPVTNAAITTALAGKQDTLQLGENLAFDADGKLNATDTTYSAGTNITIDTDGNIHTKFPEMPGVCQGTGVTCVLTSEGGEFKWAVLTQPVDPASTMTGTAAQAQTISEPVTGGPSIDNPGL